MSTNHDPYYIDFPGRIKMIQQEMEKEGLDVYLGSRLRTLSWTMDAFCPWRSYVVIPREGLPVAFTFVIDAARVADDSWLDEDHVRGYAPMGGQDQITQIADFIKDELKCGKGRIGYETGISNYLPEGNLTQYEYEAFRAALPEATFINAHHIVDRLSLIKDEGTMNRFREASRLTDIGHRAVYEALINGGFKNLTETEIWGSPLMPCGRPAANGSGPLPEAMKLPAATGRVMPGVLALRPPGASCSPGSP